LKRTNLFLWKDHEKSVEKGEQTLSLEAWGLYPAAASKKETIRSHSC
jgi:hypothetical protein